MDATKPRAKFGILELMIVVLIFAIIAAIAIPNLLRSRKPANESAAIAACKTYVGAQKTYLHDLQTKGKPPEFAPDLKTLGADNWIDRAMVRAESSTGNAQPKAGYTFKVLQQGYVETNGVWIKKSYTNAEGKMIHGHALVAWPFSWDAGPRSHFIVDQSGVIYSKVLPNDDKTTIETFDTFDPRGWTKVDDE